MSLAKIAKLLLIWTSAASLAAALFACYFVLFCGRGYRVQNESIYRNHRFVGMAGTAELSTDEGYGITTFGPHGQVVDKPLRDDVFRVLFIGDSFVEASHVNDAEKFTERFETQWNQAHPSRPLQSVNLGLYGLDFPEWIAFGANADRIFSPDLVVLFVTWLDFSSPEELTAELVKFRSPAAPATPFLQRINASGTAPFFLRIRKQIRDFIQKNHILGNLKQSDSIPPSSSPTSVDPAPLRAQLEAMQEIFGERLVVIFNSYPKELGRSERSARDQTILAVMHELAIPTVDLFPDYQKAFLSFEPPFGFSNSRLGEGHLNVHGHAIVAAALVRYLETADDLLQP